MLFFTKSRVTALYDKSKTVRLVYLTVIYQLKSASVILDFS